jgi:hypothetical protein
LERWSVSITPTTLPLKISDEALETAADNFSFPAWTRVCTGCPCQRPGFEEIVDSGPRIVKPFAVAGTGLPVALTL